MKSLSSPGISVSIAAAREDADETPGRRSCGGQALRDLRSSVGQDQLPIRVLSEDFRICRPFDLEDRGEAPLDAAERVVDQHVLAGDLEGQLDNHRPARRHVHGLDLRRARAGHRAQGVDLVEDLPDDVKRRGLVGAADPEEDPDGLADLGLQRCLGLEPLYAAVEDVVFGILVEQLS